MVSFQPLTDYEFFSLIVSIAGFVAIIVTIILTRSQTTSMAQSLKENIHEISSNQMFDMDKVFIDHPEMRPYFYARKDISENDPSYQRALAISEYLLDYFGSILVQRKRFPNVWPSNWWYPYFTYVFANSPLLCRQLKETKEWYTEELSHIMNQGEKLQQKDFN